VAVGIGGRVSRRPVVLLAWALSALTILGLFAVIWLDSLLRQAGRPEIDHLDASHVPLLLAAVSAATVGGVLAARRPRHPVGWLLLGMGLSLTLSDITFLYVRYGLLTRPGALPAASYLAGFSNSILIRKSTVRGRRQHTGAAQRSRVPAVGCAPTQAAGWRVTL
jgi:hypothetical protein